MNISASFIRKPVATTLMMVAITLAAPRHTSCCCVAAAAVNFPTISVTASVP